MAHNLQGCPEAELVAMEIDAKISKQILPCIVHDRLIKIRLYFKGLALNNASALY